MVIIALALPLEIGAKGKPTSVVLLKDANGVEIGRVIGMAHVAAPYVLTDPNYRTVFLLGQGRVEGRVSPINIYYESGACIGNAYVGPSGISLGTVFTPPVFSETAYNFGVILYTTNDAQAVTFDVNSQLDTSDPNNITCNSYPSPVTMTLYPAYPNDPSITGIQNTAYPTRMLIE